MRQRCDNLDSQLASVMSSYDSASVKAVNLEWQLQDATQQWEEERREKDCACAPDSIFVLFTHTHR